MTDYEPRDPVSFRSALAANRSILRDVFLVEPEISFPDFCEQLRLKGRKPFKLYPHQVEPAKAMFDRKTYSVTLRFWSGGGKTTLFSAGFAYGIGELGFEMGWGLADATSAQEQVRSKFIDGFLRESYGVISPVPERRDTGRFKQWANGGSLAAVGLNSPTSMRISELDVVLTDEGNSLVQDKKSESSKFRSWEIRTRNRPRSHRWRSSFPDDPDGWIDKRFDEGDQRSYHMQCYHCSELVLWEPVQHLKFSEDAPQEAVLECPRCARTITDDMRLQMAREAGRYVVAAPHNFEAHGHASFHANALAHVGDWDRGSRKTYLHYLASMLIDARRDEHPELAIQTYYNTICAKSYAPKKAERPKPQTFVDRCEEYSPIDLPEGVLFINGSVDVHMDWLSVGIWGFGLNRQVWDIGKWRVEGDYEDPETWDRAEKILSELRPHRRYDPMSCEDASGRPIVFCDANKWPDVVMGHVLSREEIGWRALITSDNAALGKPVVVRQAIHPEHRVKTVYIGSNTAKDIIFARLAKKDPEMAGYVHFPKTTKLPEFKELYAEAPEQQGKFNRYLNTGGKRNEKLDHFVYSFAGIIARQLDCEALYGELERSLEESKKVEKSRDPDVFYSESPENVPDPEDWTYAEGPWTL